MFNKKLENSNDIISFLKLSVVGVKVTITYSYDFRKITGTILKNDESWITILIPNDTFTITKEAIVSLELKRSDYDCIYNSSNRKFKLGDIVEIVNIEGLNRVLYNECSKGRKELIGLQGEIIMIDKTTCKNVTYYVVGLPNIQNQWAYTSDECIVSGKSMFLAENLKLVERDNLKFFNKSNIKSLNYKDLNGKTLKITVVDNEECLLVAGIDKENNKIYMLHSEVK